MASLLPAQQLVPSSFITKTFVNQNPSIYLFQYGLTVILAISRQRKIQLYEMSSWDWIFCNVIYNLYLYPHTALWLLMMIGWLQLKVLSHL